MKFDTLIADEQPAALVARALDDLAFARAVLPPTPEADAALERAVLRLHRLAMLVDIREIEEAR